MPEVSVRIRDGSFIVSTRTLPGLLQLKHLDAGLIDEGSSNDEGRQFAKALRDKDDTAIESIEGPLELAFPISLESALELGGAGFDFTNEAASLIMTFKAHFNRPFEHL